MGVIAKVYKVGLYMRLSREDGDNLESESISNQRTLLERYVTNHQLVVIDEYLDDGYSGGNFNRPGFKRLLNDIKEQRIDMVITKDLSRLGRDYIDTGHYVERFFPLQRVRYVAILDDIDTMRASSGSEMMPFKLGLNDMYAKDISKKVRSTLVALKQKGLFLGSTPSYGYLKDPNNKYKLILDPKYAPVVKRIFTMYHQGTSSSKIAEILTQEEILTPVLVKNSKVRKSNFKYAHLWKQATINNILRNPVYTGCLVQNKTTKLNYKLKTRVAVPKANWIIVEDTHEAIISKELFQAVQTMRNKSNNYYQGRRHHKYLLSGLIKCKDCQARMSISYDRKRDRVLTNCSNYRKFSKYGVCSSHYVNYRQLEDLICKRMKAICITAIDPTTLVKLLKDYKPITQAKQRKEQLSNQLIQLKAKLDGLYDDKFKQVINLEMYLRLSKQINKEIEIVTKEINLSQQTISGKDALTVITKFLKLEVIDAYLLKLLISDIYIHQDQTVEVHYRFKDYQEQF